jgi:hypothetical protein
MSRSKKKSIAGGITTASSEKNDKKIWHKIFRRKNKILENKVNSIDNEIEFFQIKETSDPWKMDKDGKIIYFSDLEVRKNIDLIIKKLEDNIIKTDISLGKYFAEKYIKEMCLYFKKNKNGLKSISNEEKNKFIEYFLNKYRRK